MFLANHDILAHFRKALITWGSIHFCAYSWRNAHNPYHTLLAEVLLHRTQARQAEKVYQQIIQRYPEPADLLTAPSEEVRNVLFSAGLHWRNNLLIEMVREIKQNFDGKVPREHDLLLTLPGVSAYIAGAVRCFAWNEPVALLDTNTVRITGRLLGWEIKDSSRRSLRFRQALELLLDRDNPRAFNYALLDLAHQICLRRQHPRCNDCPLNTWCCFFVEKYSKESLHECSR